MGSDGKVDVGERVAGTPLARFDSLPPRMTRNTRKEISIGDPMTLNDLRWLVEECKEMPPEAHVRVSGRKEYNQFDVTPASITVSNEDLAEG